MRPESTQMLPSERAGAAGCVIWSRARYFARLSFWESRFDAFSETVVNTTRQHSTVFTQSLAFSFVWLVQFTNRSLARQSIQLSGTGNTRPENVPIRAAHTDDLAFAAGVDTSDIGSHAQMVGEQYGGGALSGTECW
jgi:hypothetical protein